MTDDNWYLLSAPAAWGRADRAAFTGLARAVSESQGGVGADVEAARRACVSAGQASLTAAAHVLCDLAGQGWAVRADGDVWVLPEASVDDPAGEKERIRRQELVKRNEQLSQPSVRRFVTAMEKPREFRGRFVSVFSLMRDGRELSAALEKAATRSGSDPSTLRAVIDPYIQPVATGERCQHTGLLLTDIWRYFRHTWTNYYATTPGRTLALLVRDRAAPFHPVIGIAALSSAIVQISERDHWIGWQPGPFLAGLVHEPTARMACWVAGRLERGLSELYVDDLLQDGLYWPSLWDSPTPASIEQLVKEAEVRRRDHHRFVRRADFKSRSKGDPAIWQQRAESDLFRSKRCLALADLLRARAALIPFLSPKPTSNGLRKALEDPQGKRAIVAILRRAKAESVGTEIADLAVCGAIAPYNAILGGKLVSMLAASPAAVRAYRDKYSGYESEIASAMAGRPIQRRTNLVFIGTTSLYGSGSSQYNRIRVPAEVLGGTADIRFRELGRSKSFGTSHLSAESVTALVRLAEQSKTGVRVNSIFGEGVNPKLRKVRAGLELLGWPADMLLQHGRQRIVYGVNLVGNLLPYLVGAEEEPDYIFPSEASNDLEKISSWWMQRWLARRIQSEGVLAEVSRHHDDRPVSHGARVTLPPLPDPEDISL
ncbi:Druantia anti-phage system protein DruA [Nonomuraea angiospora]